MRLFPYRSPEEKKEDVKEGLWQLLIWFSLGVVCVVIFFGSAYLQLPADGWLTYMPAICMFVGFCAFYLCIQTIFGIFVDVTIGAERTIALFGVLALLAWFLKWA